MSWFQDKYDSFIAYITNPDVWISVALGILKIIFIIAIASVVIRVGRAIIHNAFRINSKSPLQISERRTNTVAKLLQNVITYVVFFLAVIMILGVLGIETKGLLAGAGVIGLAVGFGAQNLVRDVITGFFILLEDQFSVGDYVRLGKFEGVIQEIGLRTTKIKSWTGELHILPNGSIKEVTNFSLSNSVAFVDVSISYESDIDRAEKVIEDLLDELPMKYDKMVKRPELLGVQSLGASEVVLRVVSEVEPMQHFAISRALRKEIKLRLDEHGIEIPYPRMVLYNREEMGSKQVN
ncbi:mechanosensitive ion channel family protein [Ectobacillus antri]|uniref:Mechanosensitive ion channel family protein n=1 Tax=Ectobacillus antri TaxID=2486280 RepID=A0ABT6H926_9BACI|nr:mechanosensitive ion channel family protein [Ectobacillus antri]MDG4657561.1 mechanosensitive ion channel family protein [Ectobacillus antri]MDG5755165.1 mechanosensitive ion channel family protein [Ectobacillus antri]